MTVRATFNTRRGNARILPLGDVVGWQEVNDPADRDKVRDALPDYTLVTEQAEWARAIPMSYLTDRFTLLDSGAVKAHDGKARVTPARGCTWLLLGDAADNSIVWHINLHMISKIRLSVWRRERWAEHLVALRDLVATLTKVSPLGTIGGDFNNHRPVGFPGVRNLTPKWRGDQVWYDQLLVTTPILEAAVERGRSRLGSDHFPFMLTYTPPRVEPPVDPTEPPEVVVPKLNRYGTDSSGRPILMSDYLLGWWEGLVYRLGFRPTIVQGSWMSQAGGGAGASAGYHDLGGALDIRTRDLTRAQVDAVVWHARLMGGDAWERRPDLPGGFDPHIHIGIHTDGPTHFGIQSQHADYLAGGNGLSGSAHGQDHEPRPNPLVRTPPEGEFMPTADEIAKALRPVVAEEVAKVADQVWTYRLDTVDPEDRTPPAKRVLPETHARARDARDNTEKILAILTKEPTA